MPIRFSCPQCGKKQRNVSRRYIGRRVQCRCGKVFRLGRKDEALPAHRSPSPKSAKPPRPAAEEWSSEELVTEEGSTSVVFSQHESTSVGLPSPESDSAVLSAGPSKETAETKAESAPEAQPEPEVTAAQRSIRLILSWFGKALQPISLKLSRLAGPRIGNPQSPQVSQGKKEVAAASAPPPGLNSVLAFVGGTLGCAQGLFASLVAMILLSRLLAPATAADTSAAASIGAVGELGNSFSIQLLLDSMLLGILLIMNLALAIVASWQLIFSLLELRRETGAQPLPSVTAGRLAKLYLFALAPVTMLVGLTARTQAGGLVEDSAEVPILASRTALLVALPSLALVPALLVQLGIWRSREE